MTDELIQNQRQVLQRLLRQTPGVKENSFVTSAGGKIIGFAAKVISKYDYNHYNVMAVEIGEAGTPPVIVGEQVIAVNVAEPFMSQGNLPAGKYVIMFKMGEYYCFSCPV